MKTLFYLAAVCMLNGLLIAQNAGGISGRIVDNRTNSPIIGANVAILGNTLGSITDSLGRFHIENVAEGIYEIQVSYIGCRSFRKPDILVVRDKTTQIPEIQLIESSIETEGVTITAGAFQDNNDIPVSSFSFTKDEIRRSPGSAGDIFRALAALPGVATEGGEISAFSVRGGGPKDNLILVDNIPFTKVSHFDDGGIKGEESRGGRFGIFAPKLIEKADFNAGGFPARYGTKNSSIISMEIKEGNTRNITVYGHYDLFGWEANYDGPLPVCDKSGLIVSLRHVDFKTILKLVDKNGHGSPAYTDVLIKNTIEINPSHKISLLGIYSDDYYKRTIDNVFESKDINKNKLRDHSDSKYMIGINSRSLFGDAGFIQTTGYYYKNKTTGKEGYVNTAPDYGILPVKENCFVRSDINERNVSEQTYGFKTDMTMSLGRQTSLFAGFESRRNEYHFTMVLNGADTVYVFKKFEYRSDPSKYYVLLTPEEFNQDNTFNGNYYAGYSEISAELGKFTLNPGLRYEYYTYNNCHYFSPRLSMRYRLTADISFNAASGIYYQLPELSLLALNKSNNDLKNERAIHFIAGTSFYISNDIKMTAEGYYKQYDDLLVCTNRYNMKYSNEGTGRAGGFDLSIVKRFSDKYYGQACYSYSISKRDDNNGQGEYDYGFGKPHMFKVLGGYQFNERWSLTAKWIITSGLPTDDYVIYENVLEDPNIIRYSAEMIRKNGHRFGLNQSFDVRVDYRKQFRHFALNLYIDIWNLFGTKNVTEEKFLPQSGEFSAEVLGTVPSFGFSLEF
ncbi:MAG: TonB-dependent receptor [Bacteroidetes bacterium]|nr:TonB-dependent receptor [Bacteroidota bacterium]